MLTKYKIKSARGTQRQFVLYAQVDEGPWEPIRYYDTLEDAVHEKQKFEHNDRVIPDKWFLRVDGEK